MESRRRRPKPVSTRRVSDSKAPSEESRSHSVEGPYLPTLEAFLAGDAQISIGTIGPIHCAAIANDEHNMLAALIRRPGETLPQLLERLDAAVYLALEENQFTDEINTPLRR